MSLIVALVNQAGGVGKTTLTANLGFHLANRGNRVLLVDMDSQASLTRHLGYNPRQLETTVFHSLVSKSELPILTNWHSVDLVPSNKDLVVVESKLVHVPRRELRLKHALQMVRSQYDFVLIDCPPSLGLISIMSLVTSTHLLIPIKASDKALEGADDLRETIIWVRQKVNHSLLIAGAIPMMFDQRKIIHKTTYESIKQVFNKHPVHPPIPDSTDFEKSWRARKPLATLFPQHPAIQPLNTIAEHLERLFYAKEPRLQNLS